MRQLDKAASSPAAGSIDGYPVSLVELVVSLLAAGGGRFTRGPAAPPVEIQALTSEIAEYRRRKEAAVDPQESSSAFSRLNASRSG
ncbi:hypothetical protein [Amycolatopsis sp. CB00013]|uniref:hypothetical protein n=1 Tax=Amycolatopsis sp. CB00013 TaxID=1703945 RepID=UPI0011613B66|nr:hypothetical protein [Amycolatopsis sp. CB00013]